MFILCPSEHLFYIFICNIWFLTAIRNCKPRSIGVRRNYNKFIVKETCSWGS